MQRPVHCYVQAMRRGRRTPRMRPPRTTFALTIALTLVASCAPGQVAAATSKIGHAHAQAPLAEVTLPAGSSGPGVRIATAPIGLSIEYPTMAQDLGAGECPPPGLVSAMQALGSPPLSLAGDSQDLAAPTGSLSGSPASWETATLYQLPAGFWSKLRCLLSATHEPLTVGLNARSGQPGWAAQMVASAESTATNGLSFSLGNEPDLYDLPNYASLSRPLPDEEAAAANIYLQVATSLRQAVGSAPVIGPELARPAHWRLQLPRVIASLPAQTVGVHAYPLSACVTPRAVTIKGMLSAEAADAPSKLAWVVADASSAHAPAIISEANSASCGGVAGVSDSPASAVWAVRFVLSAVLTGFQEARFHFSNAPYDPFTVSDGQVLVRPLDYALAALARWLPVGATLRQLHGVRGLLAYAVTAPPVASTPSQPASGSPPAAGTAPAPSPNPGTGTSTSTGMVMLDNRGSRARAVLVRGARVVHVQAFSPARAGLLSADVAAKRGLVKLTAPPNSVLAVSMAAPAT